MSNIQQGDGRGPEPELGAGSIGIRARTDGGSYSRPATLSEVMRLLDRGSASVLAGGTDLVLLRADGLVDRADDIVDIKDVPGLRGITLERDGVVSIGAATTLQELAKSELLPRNAVADGAALVGGWQTRARATIGGNICRASPAGDTIPGAMVLDAQLELVSIAGARRVPARDFFTGPGRTVRDSNELLTRIIIPSSGGASAYVRFTNRLAMDLAVAGVAVHLELDQGRCSDARIALSAAAATPVLAPDAAMALVGTELDEPSIAAAAQLVLSSARPIDDARGSRAHRQMVLPVLAERSIGIALERARGRSEQ